MNITSAGLDFEISGTNAKLIEVLAQSRRAIQDFSTAAARGGADMDAAFEAAAAQIASSMDRAIEVITLNEAEIDKLRTKLDAIKQAMNAPGTSDAEAAVYSRRAAQIQKEILARQRLITTAREATNTLEAERTSLEEQRRAAGDAAAAHRSLRSQLRDVVEQLANMEAAGERGTEAYRQLQEEAGRLTDAMGDARQQAQILSHDNRALQATLSFAGGLAGACSAAQGAMGLFGAENENLQKAMLKVQAAMSITMGLQQLMNTLNKDSAFMLTFVAKGKLMLAAANTRLAAALGISTVAAKALMATLTLGLSVAITAVVMAIGRMQAAAAKASAEMGKIAESAAEPVGKLQLLAAQWVAVGDTMEAKKRFIADNKKAFEELGVSIRDVHDAENLLINNKDAFIRAQIEKAKAQVYIEANKDKIKTLLKQEQEAADQIAELEQRKQKKIAAIQSGKDTNGIHSTHALAAGKTRQELATEAEASYDKTIKAVRAKTKELASEITTGYTKAAEAQGRAVKILKGASIDAQDQGQEAADAMLKYISTGAAEATDTFDTLAGHVGTGYRRLFASVKTAADDFNRQLPKTLPRFDLTAMTAGATRPGADPFAEQLEHRKRLYEDYVKWATSSDRTVREAAAGEFAPLLKEGETYLRYLENQRAAIEGRATKTAADLRNLNTLNNEIAAATRQTVINDFDHQLKAELARCATLGEMLDLIAKKRKGIEDDKTEVGEQKREILTQAETDTTDRAKEETQALLKEYAAYQHERIAFNESYRRNFELISQRIALLSRQAAAAQEGLNDGKVDSLIDLNAINAQLAEATEAMQRLKDRRDEINAGSNSAAYEKLREEYKSHQEDLAAIQKRYAAQRAEAERQGDYSMIGLINAKEREEVSKLATSRLMASESWNALFADLSRMSTTAINRLYNDIENRKLTLSAQLDPSDLKALNEQLEKARQEIRQRNPFLALKESLADLRQAVREKELLDPSDPFIIQLEQRKAAYEKYQKDLSDLAADPIAVAAVKTENAPMLKEGVDFADFLKRRIDALQGQKIQLGAEFTGQDELDRLNAMLKKTQGTGKTTGQALKDTFADTAAALNFLSGCFGSVVDGMKKMGISMDEETEGILNDIGGMLQGAEQLAQGIATSNPLGIVQGSIGLVSSAFSLFNSRDRRAEKSIKRHERAVTKLKNAYTELQHAVSNALGESVYKDQQSLIANLRKQQREIQGMISDELSKKHTDQDKLEEFRERYREAGRQIQDIIKEISQAITQTNATDLAGQLADALREAFEGGQDAAKAFGRVADEVIRNAVLNAVKLQFLERPLQEAIARLQRDMGFDTEGNGTFDGLTEDEQKRFKDAVQQIGRQFQEAMELYKGLYEQLDDADTSTLSGAIKGASQESIDLLAGQTNAVRQNQVVSLSLMRDQLMHLSNIDNGVTTLCQRVQTIINRLALRSNDVRAEGITD